MTFWGVEIPREILAFAAASLVLGILLALICVWRAASLALDARAARAVGSIAGLRAYLKRDSTFATALNAIVATRADRTHADSDPDHLQTAVSADALAVLAMDALDEATDAQTDGLRQWAYMPLLLGLCGTVIGLMQLLPQDIDAMQKHLGGVLVGTLSGVAATLIASAAVAALGSVAGARAHVVTRMVFHHLLPNVAPRRVTIDIESRLLDVIDERSRALVEDVSRRLAPLAASLTESAESSTRAAAGASAIFGKTIEAIEGAPVLARVTKQLVDASQNAESASRRLLVDTQKLGEMQEAAGANVETLVAASSGISTAATALLASVQAIQRDILGDAPSLNSAIVNIEADSKELNDLVGKVALQVNALSQELGGLSIELKQFGGHQVQKLGENLEKQAGLLVAAVREQLEGSPGKTGDALRRVGVTAADMTTQIKNASESLKELDTRSRALVAFLNERVSAEPPSGRPPPASSATNDDERRGLREAAASLSASAAALNAIAVGMTEERERRDQPGLLRRTLRLIRPPRFRPRRGKT